MGKVIRLAAPISDLPKVVRIGPWKFDVVQRDMQDKSGLCDFDQCDIIINSRIVEQAQRETLLHEVLHAVMDATGLDEWLGEEQTEDAVRRLSPMLLDTLQRNVELVDYLTFTGDDDE